MRTVWRGLCIAALIDLAAANSWPPPRAEIRDIFALGDSFSAGPGAGKEWDNGGDGKGDSGHCMRRVGAYAPQLDRYLDAKDHKLHFVSCTGDETHDLLDFTRPDNQINAIKDGTTFAMLSIGGNDVQFGPIVKSCIYGAPGVDCEESKKNGLEILYGRDFFNRYNQVLDKVLVEKLKRLRSDDYTKLYQTSYIQFFDDWTEECDSQKFHWWPGAHKMKVAVRQEFNHMVNQLNEVLQYWMDIRNTKWTTRGYRNGGPETFFTGVHFVDVDWAYNNHRFCREGIEEPDRNNEDTWFFHAPINPLLGDQNTEVDTTDIAATNMSDFSWQPGRNGEPFPSKSDPKALASKEDKTRSFHPQPNGFNAEKNAILSSLDRLDSQSKLADRAFQIVVVGDIAAIGDHCGYNSETRYGVIPYLNTILARRGNFGGKRMMYRFDGTNTCGYSGDKRHEIWPELKTIGQIAEKALKSEWLRITVGTVVPLMVGSKDIMNGRSLDDMKEELNHFLTEIWKFRPKTVILLGTVPMHGDPDDEGHEFWPKQKQIIEWNAHLSAIANYHSTAFNRPIVKVHLTSPQEERIDLNVYIPSKFGYNRIAHDFFGGMLQARERGFLDDRWFNRPTYEATFGATETTYDLAPVPRQALGKINCHQPRSSDSPKENEILTSLYRGTANKAAFIKEHACNPTFNCKFNWETTEVNTDAEFPFRGGNTCITAGGIGPRHTTHHEVLVRKTDSDKDISGDWCGKAVDELIQKCIVDSANYGGYWADEQGRLVNISHTAYVKPEGPLMPGRFRLEPMADSPKQNWDHEYIPFDEAMRRIKETGPRSSSIAFSGTRAAPTIIPVFSRSAVPSVISKSPESLRVSVEAIPTGVAG